MSAAFAVNPQPASTPPTLKTLVQDIKDSVSQEELGVFVDVYCALPSAPPPLPEAYLKVIRLVDDTVENLPELDVKRILRTEGMRPQDTTGMRLSLSVMILAKILGTD